MFRKRYYCGVTWRAVQGPALAKANKGRSQPDGPDMARTFAVTSRSRQLVDCDHLRTPEGFVQDRSIISFLHSLPLPFLMLSCFPA